MATNIQSVMATNIQSVMATNIQSVRKRKERTDQQPTFSRVKTFTVFGLPLHNGMLIKLICDLLSTFLIETTENNKSSFPTCIKKTQAGKAGKPGRQHKTQNSKKKLSIENTEHQYVKSIL